MATTFVSDAPLVKMAAITASDGTTYDPLLMLLRVNGAGNLTVTTIEDVDVVIPALAGEYVPGPFKKVKAATTATGLTGWFNR